MCESSAKPTMSALDIVKQAIATTETPTPITTTGDRAQGVILDMEKPQLRATPAEIKRMLDIIERDILPQTECGVHEGNKVFGAAILRNDLSCDMASTNCETECPLFHGEVKCIYDWYVFKTQAHWCVFYCVPFVEHVSSWPN